MDFNIQDSQGQSFEDIWDRRLCWSLYLYVPSAGELILSQGQWAIRGKLWSLFISSYKSLSL